ncbi:phosphate-repressible phosphate permease pho-4 [Aspergillus lentulus]|uniref:Phosphate transporter n=1 Tax=Aspergillus lentulus TaxID=293939 RepID=A0ABQ1ADY2_ASPLE|nr:phosphate-repressible phosphate permease pho-4 [Aspergillus lentulus]GFF79643.1 phosphate-repressible phosphate permease pho-4 [Aspergillus lentulus]GFF79761.1 phosphate-repressible phosphate permease pho-4 [Aspergillus lentulus]GFG13161.1 phosphate-repressible phosphate permease pho-4 [Aspergillus lentulus]
MIPAATAKYDWILALTSITFVFSAFGNGANDVANSYATSVAARTLSMWQVGILAACTEFIGAVALGARVTSTIKSGIISIDRFENQPGPLMLAMGCAEMGNAAWLMFATGMGWPVSTTQTIVGALVGVGFAAQAPIHWEWTKGSVSQIAASWGIAPAIAAGFSAIIFGILKYSVLERKDPFKWAMRLIPVYLATTGAILALFIVVEAPTAPSLEEFGAGKAVGIILGVFFGCLLIGVVFFLPYFHRRLVKQDARVRFYHLPLGPWLLKDTCPLYFPGKGDKFVTNYYEDAYGEVLAGRKAHAHADEKQPQQSQPTDAKLLESTQDIERTAASAQSTPELKPRKKHLGPHERFLHPVADLPWTHPRKWLGWIKFCLLQGVTRDVVTHDSAQLRDIHSRARRYDDRVEHLWTYCQVVSAMMMSIAHGSNDVANAVGPWAAVYATYQAGEVDTEAPTPVWFLVIAGLLLGLGFWFYGYNIVRALGNKITQMSPTRGFATELGAAITVLLASRLGLPVSTTQCLTGAATGVALMNYDLGAVNWKQLGFIFSGWVLTLPSAGLIGGLLCLMALNTPHF